MDSNISKENLLNSSRISVYNMAKQRIVLERNRLNRHAEWAFFFLGTLNNLCVEIIYCYSNDLAKEFHHEKIMSVFGCIMVCCAILIRFVNSYLFLNIRHRYKNIAVVCLYLLGVILMLLAKVTKVFVLTLFASFCFGVGTSLGEVTNMGYMKCFPASVAGYYSSGTGLSGLIGTSFYLLLKIFKFSIYTTNLCMLVFYPLYILAFLWAIRIRKKIKENEDLEGSAEISAMYQTIEEQEAGINKKITCTRVSAIWPRAWGVFVCYFFLYFFEYVSNSWLTSSLVKNHGKKFPPDVDPPFFVTYGFEMAMVFYRFSLFLGRSTLSVFKIRRYFWGLFALFMISLFYLFVAMFPGTFPYPLMFVTLCSIAFVGGVVYTNVLFITLGLNGIPRKYMEIVVNMLGSFGEMGIFMSSCAGMIFLRFLI